MITANWGTVIFISGLFMVFIILLLLMAELN